MILKKEKIASYWHNPPQEQTTLWTIVILSLAAASTPHQCIHRTTIESLPFQNTLLRVLYRKLMDNTVTRPRWPWIVLRPGLGNRLWHSDAH